MTLALLPSLSFTRQKPVWDGSPSLPWLMLIFLTGFSSNISLAHLTLS